MTRWTGVLAAAGLLASLITGAEAGDRALMPRRPIADVLRDFTDRVMVIPGVTGTAEARCAGQPCIKVFVASDTPALRRRIPPDVEGYPVAVERTGEFRARDP